MNTTRKRRTQKMKKIDEIEEKQLETQELVEKQCNEVDADLQENEGHTPNVDELEDKENDDEDNEDNVVEPVDDDAAADNEGHTSNVAENVAEPKRKRKRGPTKMKNIAKDPNEKVHVDYTIMGEPYGPGSIPFASYLGTIVREHVPYTIRDWRKVSEDIKLVLWKSIEARFDLDQPWKKTAAFCQMRDIWRSSKSRLVSAVRGADNMKDRMDLRPPNITEPEWRKFIKEKTSNAFKVISDSMKKKRKLQIPHCLGRKGMVRLREDLIQTSSDPSQVTRAKVWVESRTKKDGTPVNTEAAEMMRKAAELEIEGNQDSTTTNPKEDILSQILGPDNPGRLRAMGRGMSLTKLSCFQVNISSMAAMEADQVQMKNRIQDLEQIIEKIYDQRQECDSVLNTKTWLWRPTAEMRTLQDSLNCFIAWPANRVVIETTSNESPVLQQSTSNGGSIRSHNEMSPVISRSPNIPVSSTNSASPSYQKDKSLETPKAPLKKPLVKTKQSLTGASPRRKSQHLAFKENQKCLLMDISGKKRVVAEGRWSSSNPDQEVHHQKLGPNACRVWVDVVIVKDAAVWRQTPEIECMADAHGTCVAWPEGNIVMDNEDK